MIRKLPGALLLSVICGACGEEPAPAPPAPPGAPAAINAPAVAGLRAAGAAREPRPQAAVVRMPGGGLALRAPAAEVQMLARQPDGSYRRICAAPDERQRAAMEAPFRARGGHR